MTVYLQTDYGQQTVFWKHESCGGSVHPSTKGFFCSECERLGPFVMLDVPDELVTREQQYQYVMNFEEKFVTLLVPA